MQATFALACALGFCAAVYSHWAYAHRSAPWLLRLPAVVAWLAAVGMVVVTPLDTRQDSTSRVLASYFQWKYWVSFVLMWFVLPLARSYWHVGDFGVAGRLLGAVRAQLRMLLALFVVVYAISHGALLGGDQILGFLMCLSNVWGFLAVVLLVGNAAVELPRVLWNHADVNKRLRGNLVRLPGEFEARAEAHDQLYDAQRLVTKLEDELGGECQQLIGAVQRTLERSGFASQAKDAHVKTFGFSTTALMEVRRRWAQLKLLIRAERSRTAAATGSNARSSRSHWIFRLNMLSRASDDVASVRSSTLTVVDLAGSESIAANADPARRRECRFINASLHALSRCVIGLATQPRPAHIPFRDSTLTRVLQPSIGAGDANVLAVCTLKPGGSPVEGHKTLRFGMFARRIETAPVVQPSAGEHAATAALLQKYRRMIVDMKRALEARVQLQQQQQQQQLQQQQQQQQAHSSRRGADERLAQRNQELKEALAARDGEVEYMDLKLRIAEGQISMLEQRLAAAMQGGAGDEGDSGGEVPPPPAQKKKKKKKKKKRKRSSGPSGEESPPPPPPPAQQQQQQQQQQQEQTMSPQFQRDLADMRRALDGLQSENKAFGELLQRREREKRDLNLLRGALEANVKQSFLSAIAHGMVVRRVTRRSHALKATRLWLVPEQRLVKWLGRRGAERSMALDEVHTVHLGRATPAFAALQPAAFDVSEEGPDAIAHSFSLVTEQRSLDVVCPSFDAMRAWTEGLKEFVPLAVVLEHRRLCM